MNVALLFYYSVTPRWLNLMQLRIDLDSVIPLRRTRRATSISTWLHVSYSLPSNGERAQGHCSFGDRRQCDSSKRRLPQDMCTACPIQPTCIHTELALDKQFHDPGRRHRQGNNVVCSTWRDQLTTSFVA